MRWTITAARTTGKSHEANGTPCQDAHAAITTASVVVLAVADGAGSAPHSKTGANLAARAATSYLAGALTRHRQTNNRLQQALQDTVHHCRTVLQDQANDLNTSIHDLATTLLVTVITKHHVAILQAGDGAIIAKDDNDELTVLTVQQEREYVNEVTFLTSNDYERELRLAIRPHHNVRAIALMTDGVETLGVHRATNTALPGFFLPVLEANTEDLATFLTSPRVCERSDDDKTILIAKKEQ